jgi:UDP-N-acetylglucosamine--N-acetylmuramyl-(pentapeptide) pyrophosphoryl-undecaprenol N-acetylglucosamine transferase
MNAAIAGGGTAGHVFPALAVADRLHELGVGVTFLGTEHGPEADLVPAAGYPFRPVRAAPLRRELSAATVRAPFTAIASIRDCLPVVRDADVVVGMGGYVSVPAVLAAVRARRKIVLHEQNAVPGLANRVLARAASSIALTFGEARSRFPKRVRTVVTGDPVRAPILRVSDERTTLAAEGRAFFGLEEGRTTILVFGGSQGAVRIDRAVAEAIGLLHGRRDLQILVLTGRGHRDEVAANLADHGSLRVVVEGFCDRMELAYAIADVVIARAGATTIAELGVCGLPSLLVPYPHATGDHQRANASALQHAGGAAILQDGDLSGPVLVTRLRELIDDPDRLASMAAAAARFGRPDAAHALAAEIVAVAEGTA